MKAIARALLALGSLAAANGAVLRESQGVSPIAKVLELLTGLEAKIKKEGEDETKAHKAYVEWCDDGRTQMGFEIKTLKAEIEDLTATKEKAISDISSQNTKIEDLSGSIAQDDADLKAATEIREKEAAEFMTAETELVDVISTLDRAINVLERKLRGSALVQAQVNTKDVQAIIKTLSEVIDAASLGNHDKKRLVAMVQDATEDQDSEDDFGAPAPQVYQSKSEGIVEVLEDLRSKAENELQALRNQETAAKHSFEMEAQSLRDSMAASTKEMNEAKATLAAASETQATSEGDLSVAIESLTETTTNLKTQSAGCETAVEDYAASQASRAEELKALAAAIESLKGGLNAAEASVYGFLQTSSISSADEHEHTSSRLQTTADLANFEVVNLIRRLARKENSAALSQLASRVAAAIRFGSRSGEDPFAKVKGLISEMIATLEKEAGQEASHKAWCDEQYGETKAKTDDLRHTVDRLTSKIDKAKATSMTLKDEVKDLQAALAQISKQQAELDQLRRGQNKAYVLAKTDMETGLRGVRQAMKVLREYYEGDAEASHTKASGAGSSIIGMLEVIQSDLSKGLAQAEMAEDSAAAEYEKVSMQNRLTVKGYEQDVKYKTKEAASLDKAVTEMTSDRDSSQTELDAVLEYSKSVRGACEVKPESYEERKARREAEVSGLKEALSILSEQGSFLQKQKRSLRLRA